MKTNIYNQELRQANSNALPASIVIRIFFVIMLLTLLPILCQGQEIVSTAGGSDENSQGSVTWVVGSTVFGDISTYSPDDTETNKEPISNIEINLYPNPFVDFVTVAVDNVNDMPYELIIHDVTGRYILSHKLDNTTTTISTETLAKGNYIASIRASEKVLDVFKIVKL